MQRRRLDINKVWLSGLACTDAVLTEMSSKTNSCTFLLQVNERYFTRDGTPHSRPNYIRIESLGKAASVTAEKVKKGARYFVEGYIRQDESRQVEPMKIRAFAIYTDHGADQVLYTEGLRQALEIIKTSRDKDAALKTLEGLVASN